MFIEMNRFQVIADEEEAFPAAHRGAGNHEPLHWASPRFEGVDIVQTVTRS